MRRCTVEGCGRKHLARDLCSLHYSREYDAKNRERIRARRRAWYLANPPSPQPGARWCRLLADDVDEAVVLRLIAGERPSRVTSFERREAVRRLRVANHSYRQIAERLQIHHRQIARDLYRFGLVTPRARAMDNGEVA